MAYVDIPLDGRGLIAIPAAETISPVFTLWVTLVLLYLANSLADYSSAAALQAGCTANVRKGLLQAVRARLRRTKSAENTTVSPLLSQLPSRAIEVRGQDSPRRALIMTTAWLSCCWLRLSCKAPRKLCQCWGSTSALLPLLGPYYCILRS